jgi:hypothetical protein
MPFIVNALTPEGNPYFNYVPSQKVAVDLCEQYRKRGFSRVEMTKISDC